MIVNENDDRKIFGKFWTLVGVILSLCAVLCARASMYGIEYRG